jgi:hypothetical protein
MSQDCRSAKHSRTNWPSAKYRGEVKLETSNLASQLILKNAAAWKQWHHDLNDGSPGHDGWHQREGLWMNTEMRI